jgi:hypothetical protein
LRSGDVTDQARPIFHKMNVGAWPSRLPFVRTVNHAHELAQLDDNRRDQARMAKSHQAGWAKTIEATI